MILESTLKKVILYRVGKSALKKISLYCCMRSKGKLNLLGTLKLATLKLALQFFLKLLLLYYVEISKIQVWTSAVLFVFLT